MWRGPSTGPAFAIPTAPVALAAADGLVAELDVDARSIRDALADDRARRRPDREAPADRR